MNQQAQALILSALTSGSYRRTEGTLRERVNGRMKYCVMGVICDVYAKTVKKPKIDTKWTESPFGYSFGGSDCGAPRAVLGWAGLSEVQADELISMNDSGMTFGQLAKEIAKL